jgi:excisionase family DNA binding protein
MRSRASVHRARAGPTSTHVEVERRTGLGGKPGSEFLLSEDVAELLGVSRSTVQEWLGRCRIPHRKLPFTRRCIIVRADFEAWLDGCELETTRLAGGGRIVKPKESK